MNKWKNILDEEVLKFNVNFAALFVMNFECLKEYVVSRVKDFYIQGFHYQEGEYIWDVSDEYRKNVRSLDKQIDNASLKWFLEVGAITENDFETYQKARKRRNEITHELLKNICCGFEEEDGELFLQLQKLYQKIDKWWINEIEIPTSLEQVPADYQQEGVYSGQAMILEIINDIVLGSNSEKYKDILVELMKYC